MDPGVVIQDAGDGGDHGRSLVAFEEMLEFLVIRLSQASDALSPPGEEGELTSALHELTALMNGLAEELVMESPTHRHTLLRTSLLACLRAILGRTFAGEPDGTVISVQEALQSVARALAKVLPVADGTELEGVCESLMLLLDKRQAFYRHTGVPGGGVAPGVEGADLLAVMSEEEWRRGIGFADWVDAISSESTADVRRWRRAQIVEESSVGRLRLSFESLSDFHDEWVDRDSANIAPPGTRAGQEVGRWRQSLQPGSLVDALDPNNTWTNATVMDVRERLGAPVVLGVGAMGGSSTDKVLDLLISFRVYDPDGDREEPLLERHEAAGEAGQGATWALYASPAARREELDAMAAAAAQGGLAARPRRAAGVPPLEPLLAVGRRQDGAAEAGGAPVVGFPAAGGSGVDLPDVAVGGGADAVAAPAAGGWGLAGRSESSGGGSGSDSGSSRAGGRGQRYFGLSSRDEWITASSSRIEKLNSRAPWKNSWTEEAPVNDKDDPYLTEDGASLVFAVPRAPVDGSPCLVANINEFGQEGGFENLIVRLSPPAPEDTLPAPVADAPLPPAPPPSTSSPSTPSLGAGDPVLNPPQPPAPLSPPPPAQGQGQGQEQGQEQEQEQQKQREQQSRSVGESAEISPVTTVAATAWRGGEVESRKKRSAGLAVPLETLRHALVAVSSVRPLLARRVAKAILDRTATAVAAALKGASDSELRGLTRERLEGIMNGFREVLKRGHRSSEAFRRVERLKLDLALKLYSCPFMERKLQGLKVLADALTASETAVPMAAASVSQGNFPALTPQELVKWLEQKRFVKALFADHTQLIRRSGDVLGFLCRERALSAEYLDIIWAAGGGGQDKDRRICVHEVLRPLLYQLDMALLERLVDKLRLQPADEVIEDTVAFIRDMADATQQGGAAPAIRLLDLLWLMADDKSPYRPRIKATAAESILPVTGLRGLKGHRSLTLERCVNNVQEGRAVVTSLKVLEAVLQNYPRDATTFDALSRRDVIHSLEAERGLTELLLRELESYVASSRCSSSDHVEVRGAAHDGSSRPASPLPAPSKASVCTGTGGLRRGGGSATGEAHLAQVKARLHTLQHVHDNSRLVLSTEQVKRLWACLGPGPGLALPSSSPVAAAAVDSPSSEEGKSASITAGEGARATPGEISTLLSWLSKACEACEGGGGGGMFEPGVAAELFQDLILSDGERRDFAAKQVSPEWFSCFQTFFFTVNRQAGRMYPSPDAGHFPRPPPPTASTKASAGVSSSGTEDRDARRSMLPRDPDAPLDVVVMPSDLSGMRALWNVALEAEDVAVVDQATRLLNRTHQELAPDLQDHIGEIRKEFINTCMAYVKEGNASGDDVNNVGDDRDGVGSFNDRESTVRRQRSVVRALHLLEEFVDETEMGGTARLRGHGARVRGAKVLLKLDNKIPTPNQLPATFKLEMHSNSQVWEVRRSLALKGNMPVKDLELKVMRGASDGETGAGSRIADYGGGSELRSVEALDRSNSRRLGDLGLRSDDVWVMTVRTGPVVGRVPLLDGDGKLLSRPRAIFQRWFCDFQNADGLMDRVGAAKFIDSCCHDQCKPTDDRVKKFFRNYDSTGDGRMRQHDFLRLFQDSCKDMPEVVWSNLKAHHYRNDLTRPGVHDITATNVKDGTVVASDEDEEGLPLPRSIISRDALSIKSLLAVLSLGGPAAAAAWRFLMRLPTNPEMLDGVRRLQGFQSGGEHHVGESEPATEDCDNGGGGEGWKTLLGPPGSHRLLYTLQIVDGVLDSVIGDTVDRVDGGDRSEVGGKDTSPTLMPESSPEIEEMDCGRWVADFVRSGGFSQFCEAILTRGVFGDDRPERMVDAQQGCLALIIKVVRIVLLGVLSVSIPPSPEATRGSSRAAPTLGQAPTLEVEASVPSSAETAPAVEGEGGTSVHVDSADTTEVALPLSSSVQKDGVVAPGVGREEGEGVSSCGDSPLKGGGSGAGAVQQPSPEARDRIGDVDDGGDILSPPSVLKPGSREHAMPWACLPRDVLESVVQAVDVPELQARLMELAGTAADIADAAYHGVRSRRRWKAAQSDAIEIAPLNLFGWVGEGAPCDAMAEEALRLWGGVSRTPRGSCQPSALTERDGSDGQDQPAGAIQGHFRRGEGSTVIDVPILKAIFCVSDAIRRQLAHSLLSVCAGGGGALRCDALVGTTNVSTRRRDGVPLERGDSSLSTSVTTTASDAVSMADTNADTKDNDDDDDKGASRATKEMALPSTSCTPTTKASESDGLRDHVVRLLLDNIPRVAKPGKVSGAGQQQQQQCGEPGLAAGAGYAARPTDCTQLFDVLCVLVEGSIRAAAGEGQAGGASGVGSGDGAAVSGKESDRGRFDVDALAEMVVERLLAHPCTERRGAKDADKDTLLVGLLKLGLAIVDACPEAAIPVGEGLVEALLEDFLFAPPTPATTESESLAPTRPKCKTVASRAMAYKLLAALCKPRVSCRSPSSGVGSSRRRGDGDDAFDSSLPLRLVLQKGFTPLRKMLSKPDVWGYSPSSGERSSVGRVGLRNLGNTCYVNSCLQQLFTMEPLRNGLLSLSEGDTDPGSLVAELQKLFGHLTLSEKQAVDPLPFLRTVKDLDGNAIDVSVQQDAQGFLLDLFDKMEAGLKNTPQASLMSTFEGGQITQLICPKPRPSHAPAGEGGRSPTADATATGAATVAATLGGEQEPSTGGGVGGNDAQVQQGEGDSEGVEMRERGEAFMCVSLEVKNMVGVEDALEKFTEKEIIEGYAWDDERKDVSIHKRTVLGRLPPNVVLHLNRFKMNLDTFQTEKVNTRFDFPIKLDLEPFTKEGLAWRERVEAAGGRGPEDAKRLGLPGPYEVHPRSYYTYQLRGVVVHTGTANQGHYFSYIREDSKPTQNRPCSDVVGDSGIDVGGEVTHGAPTRPVQPSAVAEGAVSSPSTTTTSVSVDDTTGTGSSSNRSNSAVSEEMKEPPGTASGTAAGGSASTAWHDGFCVGGKFSMGMPPVDSAIARGVGAVDSDGQGQESHRWCEFNDTVVREWTLEGRRRGKTGVEQEGGREGERDGGGADSMSRIGGLETDCFGGQQTMQETDEYGWPRTLRKDNIQNAYLLFYERIDQSYGVEAQPEPVSPEREEGEERETHAGDGGNDGAKPTPLGALAPTTVAEFGSEDSSREAAEGTTVEAAAVGAIVSAATIPPGVFRAVWDDNNKFLLDRQLYHPDMSNFVLEIMKAVRQLAAPEADGHASRMSPDSLVAAAGPSVDVKHDCDGPASLEATGAVALVPKGAPSERGAERGYLPLVEGFLEWGVQYLLNNLARALDNEAFGPIVDQLQGLYDLRPDLAGAFLDAETEAGLPSMREMLLLCPDRPVRVAMRGFYLHLLGILAEGEGDRYLDYEEASLPQVEGSPSPSEPYSTSVSTSVSEAASLTPTSTPAQSGPAPPLEEDSVSGPADAEEREEDKGRPATRLGRLVAGWVGLLPDAARSWGRFEQFLEFIEGVGNMGDRERDLLLSRRMVCRLSSFLLQEKSPVYDPQKRLPRMGHKTAPPRFAPLVRCLRSLRAHSGETSRWQPRGVIQVESDTDTASDSEGSRSDDSTRAVVALPVGPGMPLTTSTAAASLSMSPEDQEAREAAAAVEAVRRLEEASAAPAAAAESMIVDSTAEAVVRSVGSDGTVAAGTPTEGSGGGGAVPGGRSKMTAKERSRSVALSLGCRRCLNCETLYELAFEEQHAPEAAADLMCSWAADGSKLVRPLSRMIVQGIDSTPFADVDSWLLALRSWLEIDDTLQAERHELVLGTGKPEAEPKLLLLMVAQKDKYEKWLFRVLTVLSELMVENPAIGLYVSKLRGHEMLPWSDWMTKHLIDTYSTLRGAGPTRVNETDLVQIKENLGAYEKRYFGYTAEERLLDMARRAKMGPAEGETGMTRVESSTSNGVQVEMLDVADSVVMGVGMGTSSTGAGGVLPGGIAFKRFWRVTNHRMDSVNFTFKVDPTSVGRLDTVYPPRRPNFHVPLGCEIKRILQPRDCVVLMEVEKIDLTKEFQPHPFSWVFESITTPPPEAVSTAQQAAAVPAAPPPVVPAAAAVLPASPPSAMTMTMTPSDLLEQQAQLDGDLGEVARVALACEREEAAAEEAAAIAAAKADEELSEALAATAASLPVIPYEVVSKMKAETAAETKVGDVAAAAAAAAAAASAAQGRRQRQAESAETAAFWEAGRRNSALVELEARSNVDGEALLKEELLEVAGKGRGQEEENIEENDENDETVLFSHEDSSVHSMTNSEEGDETLQDGDSAGTGSRGRSAA